MGHNFWIVFLPIFKYQRVFITLKGSTSRPPKIWLRFLPVFGYGYHQDNPGVLPTLLTLLLDQCLDQAATVSMARPDRQQLYHRQPIPLTELGYAVPRIEATLVRDGDFEKVRDHTFSQLTAMVADVRGSMMLPVSGSPTRNFQVGQVLAAKAMSINAVRINGGAGAMV